MNIVKNIDQYNDDFVYFCDPIKNNIMNNGNFIRILYSTSLFVLNGIYLNIYINQLKINILGKAPQYKIYEQISNGNIKIFSDNIDNITNNFLLKIAGVWETEYHYGLTYKFIKL